MMRSAVVILLALATALLPGCATTIYNKPGNEPLAAGAPFDWTHDTDVMHENSIVLSFSGGGLRAASFAHGVLEALKGIKTGDGDLLDDVSLISSVSGSSLTSAYFGLHGREGLDHFRDEVLLPGFEGNMRLSLLNPANIGRVFGGGLNAREDFAEVLDKKVFHGAKFADLYRRPRPAIRIHATDLYNRVPFPFLPPLWGVLCSDLTRYPVADAVAASMAVPLVFAPIVVRTYPGNCPPLPPEVQAIREKAGTSHIVAAVWRALTAYRDPHVKYIKLGDGGLTDNFAINTLTVGRIIFGTPYAPMSARDAVRIRRLLLIVVDASRGPNGDWIDREDGPTGMDLALSATDSSVDSAARLAADAFDAMILDWQDSIVRYRCGLKREEIARFGGPPSWNCRDVKFNVAHLEVRDLPALLRERVEAIPTRLSLEPADIDAAIEGGMRGTLALPALWQYLSSRVASP